MRPTAYRRNARGLRDRQAFERVRLQAGALFAAGHTQAQVTRQLGVARAWLGRQRSWLVVEPLPGYAPELNPVEGLWANLKGVELANLAGDTLAEVTAAADRGIQRICDTHHLA